MFLFFSLLKIGVQLRSKI